MLDLTIAANGSAAPRTPDESDPSATVWRDDEGTAVAFGQTIGDLHWVHLPGVGAYSFAPDAPRVTALPEHGVGREVVEDAFRRMVLPLALQAQGREVLHASAVRTPDGVIALCARSGTGKSTIARALSGRGHLLWADDAVCFELNAERVEALPVPFTLRLRPASAEFFKGADTRIHSPVERVRLTAVFVLERSETAAEVERLEAAPAFREVLTHGYYFSVSDRTRNAAMIQNYLELVDRVPVFCARFPEGLDRLGELLDAIEAAR
jgi:hypothetical protein